MTGVHAPDRRFIVVDIADLAVSNDPADVLITHAIGSCIAVAVHDPIARVGGLLRYALPDSSVASDPNSPPATFCNTGMPLLLEKLRALGAAPQRLVMKIAGASQLLDESSALDIGKRNYLALRRFLKQEGISLHAQDVGGAVSRTLRIHIGTGQTRLRIRGRETLL